MLVRRMLAFHVNNKDKPWGATVEFSSSLADSEREKAFALNTKCFCAASGMQECARHAPRRVATRST
jgi:hypothetical protein